MPSVRRVVLVLAGFGLASAGCGGTDDRGALAWHQEEGYRWSELSPGRRGRTGFAPVAPSRTGIAFRNDVTQAQVVENRHYLNGSGVAAGDVDGDGWVDVYFAGLSSPDRLYRNRGGFGFEDVTDSAGLARDGRFSSGVVLVDVDGDRDLDLLVGSVHDGVTLHLNDGSGRFTPAPASGLATTRSRGNSTLALADVDGDGDLDLYVTNYRERSIDDIREQRDLTWEKTIDEPYREGKDDYALLAPFDAYYTIVRRPGLVPERREVGERDQLFLNDGAGHFTEARPEDHFLDADGHGTEPGRDWGLTGRFHDLNGDGLPDLYVCNDFWTPDRVWMNQGGGVFREIDPFAIRSFSFSSMAVGFSDVDRDGFEDIFTTEMLSPLHAERTRQYIPDGPWPDIRFEGARRPQYNRNSLYHGRGDGTWEETAYHSGVEASGWSWAAEFLDVDLDGYEDLLVTNGFPYDLQDLDTQLRLNQAIGQGTRASRGQLIEYPPLPQVNEAFRNNGDLTFTEESDSWGFAGQDVSQGMALADFDRDGDLDLAVGRLNDVPAIYENTGTGHRIAVRLEGRAPNTAAVGAELELRGGPVIQTKTIEAGGSYLSGSEPLAVFAAGDVSADHTLVVTWPGGGLTTVEGVRADRLYEVAEPEAAPRPTPAVPNGSTAVAVFEDVSASVGYTHHEDPFDDFRLQPLLPVLLSREGPGVSWVDFDQDGDDDLLVAAGRGGRTGALENRGAGRFGTMSLGALAETAAGDQTTILGWASAEGVTLVVGDANLEQGNVGAPAAVHYALSNGELREVGRLPDNRSTTGPLAAADYDGDGDVDLFVGGRFVPARYPTSATSRLFRNEDGRFVADGANAGPFQDVGLVTGAVFTDFDLDGDADLVLSLEWGSLRLYRNDDGRFRDVSEAVGLTRFTGWWMGVASGDLNNDGRPDLVATNWGTNSPYQFGRGHPLRMYYEDFNFDGRVDILEAYFDEPVGGYVPRRQLQAFQSIPGTILRNVSDHAEFASASLERILGGRTTPFREITTLEPMVFLNEGGTFSARPLPREARLTNGFAAAVADYDNDGNEDVFLSQNLFSVQRDVPRLDAGRGLWLKGDGSGSLVAVPGQVSGVEVYGEQRGAALADFDGDGRVDLAVAQNGGPLKLYANRTERAGLRVRLRGPESNGDGIGSSLRVLYDDGSEGPLREIQAGAGYWSQNSAVQVLGAAPGKRVAAIEVTWFDGTTQRVEVSDGKLDYVASYPR